MHYYLNNHDSDGKTVQLPWNLCKSETDNDLSLIITDRIFQIMHCKGKQKHQMQLSQHLKWGKVSTVQLECIQNSDNY